MLVCAGGGSPRMRCVLTAAKALPVGSLVPWHVCPQMGMSAVGAQGLALLLAGAPPVTGKAVPLSATPPMGGRADVRPQRP